MFSCQLALSRWMAPGGLWETPVLLFFCPQSPSIYLCPSICLLLLCFLPAALLSPARSTSLCPFPHLAIGKSDETVGTEEICNSLSVFLSPYLSPNVFHLGFSISMSLQSLGCQTQLKGHYWQFRAWLSVRVRLIFLLSGRGTVGGSVCCPWSTWTLICCISKTPVQHWRLVA